MDIIIIMIVIFAIAGVLKIVLNSDKYKQKIGTLEKNNNITITTESDMSLKNKDFYRDIPFDKNKYYVFF